MASIGFAAIIIHDATITPSVKKDLASRIFRLFKVDKYLYVTKKLAELIIEEFNTKKTPINPISTFPIAVNLVLAENGVIIAHPGNTSLALRSTAQTTESSSRYRRYKVFWWRAARSLHRHASRLNLNCRQLELILCCNELVKNIL